MKKSVFCEFDDDGVYVYQALNPSIVALAVENGTFGKNFDQGRTSWIKPSFSWILQHTYAGTKHNMKAVARVKIHHWAWQEILENSELSHYNDDLHGDRMLWQNSLKKAKVICQWDPEKGLDGNPLGRQSIQLGLKAPILKDYVERYIIRVEELQVPSPASSRPIRGRAAGTFPWCPRNANIHWRRSWHSGWAAGQGIECG